MEKIMNKYIAILIGVLVTVLSFSSCTDQDDVEMSYDAGITITAANLFSNFQTVGHPNDFEMDGNQILCLTALIYDENGKLVDKYEEEFNSLSSSLNLKPTLANGKYKIISIASFKDVKGGNCWDIENIDQLEYLTITNTIKFNGVFTTIGVNDKDFEVNGKGVSLQIDIKPITSLISMFYWNNNLNSTTVGYTPLASYVEETIIKAPDFNNKIIFSGNTINFTPFSNGILYELGRNYPLANMKAGKSPTSYSYIAMLPTDNMYFYPTLKFTKQAQLLLGMNEEESGQNTKQICLESGKQYVLDMLLAAPKLFLSEYDKSEIHEDRLNRLIAEYNEELKLQNLKLLQRTVDYNFHSLIGESKAVVENSLNFERIYGTDDSDAYRAADDMLGKDVVVKYWDSTKSKVKQIVILCEGCFSDDTLSMDSFHQFLENKYVYQELVSTPQVRYYFSSPEFKDTKYVVILDNTRSYLVYDAPELH